MYIRLTPMRLGAKAPESAMRFNPLTVIIRGAIGTSVLVSELPDTLSLDYRGRRTTLIAQNYCVVGRNYLEKRVLAQTVEDKLKNSNDRHDQWRSFFIYFGATNCAYVRKIEIILYFTPADDIMQV